MTYRLRPSHAPVLALTLTWLLAPLAVRATPVPAASPRGSTAPVSVVPEDTTITIGYSDGTLIGRLPLVLAEANGYLRSAGFTEVQTVQVEEPLPGLLNGSLDLAIIDARQAADAHALGLPIQVIAGHRVTSVTGAPFGSTSSPAASRSPGIPVVWPGPSLSPGPSNSVRPSRSPAPGASSPWVAADVVVATTESLTTRPGTVAALTVAYVRALQDLQARFLGLDPSSSPAPSSSREPGTSLVPAPSAVPGSSPGAIPVSYGDPFLDAAAVAGIEVSPDVLATWPAPLAAFAPFDGGFDDATTGDGLGSLRNLFLADAGSMPDLGSLVSSRTLHAAQQALGLPLNPVGPTVAEVAASPAPSAGDAP